MRLIYIVILLLLLTLSVNAQSNFKQGYIITNDHDSIIGLIDFRTDTQNSHFCRFKQSEKSPEQIYYPGDIFSYRFIDEGKYYVSHTIVIDGVSQKVFLEYLINGMMNLYYYYDSENNLSYYFFENENKELVSITKKEDIIEDNRLKKDTKYIGVLSYVFKDYPTIKKDLNNTSFSRSSMIHLVKEYHELTCSPGDVCVDFENDYKKHYVNFDFSIYGGVQVQNYSFKTKNYYEYDFDQTKSLSPIVGGAVGISLPRFAKSMSVVFDVALSILKGESESTTNFTYKKYEFNACNLTGRINLKYSYPSGKYRPTIEAGMSIYKFFDMSGSLYTESRIVAMTNRFTKDEILFPSLFSGFNCAIGLDRIIKNNAIFFRISYEKVSHDDAIQAGLLKMGYTF